jgi:hypothetical protein
LQSRPRFQPVYQNGSLRIFEDGQAAPLAFFEDAPQQPLPVQFGDNELTIDTRTHPGAGTLSLSLVPLAGYSWSDQSGKSHPVPVAPEGRMRIPGVSGGGNIKVRYHEPGLDAFLAISLAAFALIATCLFMRNGPTD